MNPSVKLAKSAVEKAVKENEILEPESVLDSDHELFDKRAGAFVTLKKNGNLRGCIGTYLPGQDNLAQEVVYNAVGAALRDHRFGPVRPSELSDLDYEVCVLGKPEPISSLDDLNPEQYGIVIKSLSENAEDVELDEETKTSVLLPDLEGIESVQQQISVACKKARINPEREKIKVWRFEAEYH